MSSRHYHYFIADLLRLPDVQRLRATTNHHWKRDRFSHSYAVGRLAHRMAQLLHANVTVASRAGFIHDWYHGHHPDRQYLINADNHHFKISHQAAQRYGEHPRVLHAIKTHFWPWGRTLPRTREAWIVWMADNLVWVGDLAYSLKHSIRSRRHASRGAAA